MNSLTCSCCQPIRVFAIGGWLSRNLIRVPHCILRATKLLVKKEVTCTIDVKFSTTNSVILATQAVKFDENHIRVESRLADEVFN
jgi:hypothetical protein